MSVTYKSQIHTNKTRLAVAWGKRVGKMWEDVKEFKPSVIR